MATDPQHLELNCESCGAQILIEPLMRTARCPYCDSPSVVDRPAAPERPDPVFTVGFAVDRETAARAIRDWLRSKWFAPTELRAARAESVQGIYLPTYLYSATADTMYSAVVGEIYETTRVDLKKKGVRRVQEIEYQELKGEHAVHLADVVVSASRGLPNSEIEAIEPFDLDELKRYAPGFIAGWISEEPSMTREECRVLAREEGVTRIDRLLRSFMPGDTLEKLKHHTRFKNESIDLSLLPVWVFAIRRGDTSPPVRLLVNGQTGRVHGSAPVSWKKVAVLAASVVGLLALIALLGRLV
jgi:hypothetical protein